jgi:hypothetical protein
VSEYPLLISILTVLDIWDGIIPPFASTLFFELQTHDLLNSSQYLTLTVNGKSVLLPYCAPSNCTYPEFKNFVQQIIVPPDELSILCKLPESAHEEITIGIIEDWIFAIISILLVVIFMIILISYITFNLFKSMHKNKKKLPGYKDF